MLDFISLEGGNVRLFVFHWWLMWPFVHSYNARRCSQRGMLAEFLTCGGVFCLSEFFVMAFSARELLLLFLLCIRYERSDQSVSIVLSFKDDRNIVTKRPAPLKLPSA
ncbi:hypothetical protein T01_9600 [Trichinella spiralis]|uniref:Uncharacterized protein n=1 Tax=Trichinella spiralis TaxID=6334 RepID=A0A0V1AUU8_TRISP|nr:hypothetical protein T01_9600 [Trichinella spiralis]